MPRRSAEAAKTPVEESPLALTYSRVHAVAPLMAAARLAQSGTGPAVLEYRMIVGHIHGMVRPVGDLGTIMDADMNGLQITKRLIAIVSLTLLSGCTDLFGIALGVKPGQTVRVITTSQNGVVLEYTSSYSWELQAAGQIADQQCSRFYRHARLVSVQRENIDISMATFACE